MSDTVQIATPAKRTPDFVNVRLSAAGVAFAGAGGKLHVATGRMAYVFEGTAPQRVVYRGDWTATLAMTAHNGACLFEIVPDATASTTTAPAAATSSAPAASSTPSSAPAQPSPSSAT